MTRRLEEVLNLPSSDEEIILDKEEIIEESAEIVAAMSNADKIDSALTTVVELEQHDNEMDEIAGKAIKSYTDLCNLGKSAPDTHLARIYEVAATMLNTAMSAKDAKVNRKLKTLELQIKKMRLDHDVNNVPAEENDDKVEFDRNELLKRLAEEQDK